MRTFVTIVIANLAWLTCLSQESILITKDKTDYYEEYYVLKSDKKTKNGKYVKFAKTFGQYSLETVGNYKNGYKEGYWEKYYSVTNNIESKGYYRNNLEDSIWTFYYPQAESNNLEEVITSKGRTIQVKDSNPILCKSGQYKNGKLIGVWEFFDEQGQLFQKYDFDKRSLCFANGKDINNIEAGFIEGEFLTKQELYKSFNFYNISLSSPSSGKVVFEFTIDNQGQIKNIRQLENTIANNIFLGRAKETVKSLNNIFYPKTIDGITQSSTKTITFEIIEKSFYSKFLIQFN